MLRRICHIKQETRMLKKIFRVRNTGLSTRNSARHRKISKKETNGTIIAVCDTDFIRSINILHNTTMADYGYRDLVMS